MAPAQRSDDTRDTGSASWLEGVRDLIAALQGTAVNEVEIRTSDTVVFLRRRPGVVLQARTEAAPAAPTPAQDTPRRIVIQAPLNGLYYDRSSPEAAPFVQVGDHVETGQVVGLIEAMKVFNEIHAETAGTVTALLVEPGDMVQSGQDLIALELKEPGDGGT